MVDTAMEGARLAAEEGVEVEVIDLRTVAPIDIDAIVASVRKTSRLVIAHEAVGNGGLGAEIAARIADVALWCLDGPIKRVAPPSTPAPYSPALENLWLPDASSVLSAIREVMK
jgi:2-oxoisovalerate dehydrogenase E1 component